MNMMKYHLVMFLHRRFREGIGSMASCNEAHERLNPLLHNAAF